MTPNVFLDSSQYIYEKNVDPLSRIALFMKFLAFFCRQKRADSESYIRLSSDNRQKMLVPKITEGVCLCTFVD